MGLLNTYSFMFIFVEDFFSSHLNSSVGCHCICLNMVVDSNNEWLHDKYISQILLCIVHYFNNLFIEWENVIDILLFRTFHTIFIFSMQLNSFVFSFVSFCHFKPMQTIIPNHINEYQLFIITRHIFFSLPLLSKFSIFLYILLLLI